MHRIIRISTLIIILTLCLGSVKAANDEPDSIQTALRAKMSRAFNEGDSAKFFPAVKELQDYFLSKNDLRGYYTQRCNEIVFLMNRERIIEAYKLARQLSKELRERKLDDLMYMAVNMMGHINRYCGNEEEAKKNWREVLRMMRESEYYQGMPPIYMNIVNVALDDDPAEADSLMAEAMDIAEKYAPERCFDIETRRSLSYYNRGDFKKFIEGYNIYKKGVEEGKSSVHGRTMEIYYTALQGHVDEAVEMANRDLSDDALSAIPLIYERAGRWQDAYFALKKEYEASDSIVNVVISNSMHGIQDEINLYDSERRATTFRTIGLVATIILLSLLIVALVYIVQTRRRHLRELTLAYQHAMESDKMKASFIQNISHEIRTPLNIISGFSQVIANPELTNSQEERKHMAEMMQKNAHQVTSLLDEIIGLSLIESTAKMKRDDHANINEMMREVQQEYKSIVNASTTIRFESALSDEFTIVTNESMLRRIVNALMENASKYTPEGTITMRAVREEGMLRITIEDTGCGVPDYEAEHIFERFVKLDAFKEGIGLGLPLSRTLAEQLGGTLCLDTSYTAGGARFVLKLPII